MEKVTTKRLAVYSGRTHRDLAVEVASHLNLELGPDNLVTFSNGEIRCGFGESVRGTDVFVQGAFYSGGGQAVAATGGQFQINDFIGDRQVVGSFAGDRGGAQPPPPTVNP